MIPVGPVVHSQVLLDRNTVVIQRPTGGEDEHGWALGGWAGAEDVAEVQGSVQWTMPSSDNSMTSNGHGPYSPALTRTATAYLPPDCGVQAGDLLTVEGYPTLAVRSFMLVEDPRPGGDLDCIMATVEEVLTS